RFFRRPTVGRFFAPLSQGQTPFLTQAPDPLTASHEEGPRLGYLAYLCTTKLLVEQFAFARIRSTNKIHPS
ncbi:hypothetical protein HMPREF1556_00578, partial [Porphyromonas sp. oral taxon 278 str. W7784]